MSASLDHNNGEEIISAFANAPIVDQLDVVPTLSVLLGTAIPVESQGVVLQPFLRALLSTKDFTKALLANVDQLWKWATRGHGASMLIPDALDALGNAHSSVIGTHEHSENSSQVDLALETYLKVFKEQCRGQTNDNLAQEIIGRNCKWMEYLMVSTIGFAAYFASMLRPMM